MIMIC